MTISSPRSPAINEAAGLKTQLMARLNRSRRIARLTCQRKNLRLKARTPGLPYAGIASGLSVKMFGSTSRSGLAAAASFWNARRTSALDAAGVRYPMELTHSTRLSRAINRIRCVFDSGSPFQSWLKHSMSLPRKEPAATVAGAFLIATFKVVISVVEKLKLRPERIRLSHQRKLVDCSFPTYNTKQVS